MARTQLRRGTAAEWTSADPILGRGEVGVECDPTDPEVGKMKVGNGVDVWSDLNYLSSGSTGPAGDDGDWSTVRTPNTQTDDYTLVIGDAGKQIIMNKATAYTLTIPANATVAFDIGLEIPVINIGAGLLTVEGAGAATPHNVTGLDVPQWGRVLLTKTATDVWVVSGDTVA